MSKAAQPSRRDTLFRTLAAGSDEAAAVQLFVTLCCNSPELRHWLWEDFAREPATRDAFGRSLKRSKVENLTRFADLTGEGAAWHETARDLRAQLRGARHGGRSRSEIEALIVRHQAGQTDLTAFLLARQWSRLRQGARIPPRLLRSAFAVVDAALHDGDLELLRQVGKAGRSSGGDADAKQRRANLGYSDWWKLHTLHFILSHPAPAYRTRDVAAHLRSLGLNVKAKELRRFLGGHGIRRDMRAGRPRKNPDIASGTATRSGSTARAFRPAGTTSEFHRP
jgi:hypothetical protein